ncbi:MAG TPA: S53 family peptidase [Acidobacteriaceae bacterium]|nr:S53 family peptidase [Acidobacteriaceae bacterium]
MAAKKSAAPFSSQSRVVLPGSEKPPLPAATGEKPARPSSVITVSVIVRRKAPLNLNRLGKERLTRTQFRQRHGADPDAVRLVRAFAKEFGLKVEQGTPRPGQRTIKLSGTVSAMQRAFGVSLTHKELEGNSYRIREGSIHLPADLAGAVEAVLGLDNRPQAKPHFRIHANAGDTSYTPVQVAQLYQFPQGATATGQTIGIIELGGGYRTTDLSTYFKGLGQAAPKVTAVSVDGGKNTPGNANGADGEVMLDIEVAGAVAPGASIAVYFAPNTDQGFIDAVTTAVHDSTNNPSVISISWGGPESSWTSQALSGLDDACQSAAALGITITVAAGDDGSSDGATGNNVDFPASSPYVLACGGTKLDGTTTITSEVVWNEEANKEGATGGGVSNVFPLPSYQANANVPPSSSSTGGRGVPDVAGDADPVTGYQVRVDGQNMVIGGTSAVAPLWAGLIALNNQQNGKSAGFLQPQIYAAKGAAAFHDIVSGNNGAFSAGPGWDACTGLGSPIGVKLIALLGGGSAPTKKKGGKKNTGKKPVRMRPAKKKRVRRVRSR